MTSSITLYNSLTHQKEIFVPIDESHIRLYACGPTVYNYAHIGNARMAIVFDLLSRVLRHRYPKVTYVSNITDVDDKIIDAARESKQPIHAITEKFTRIYNEDMAYLGVNRPDIQPKATTHVSDMIQLIEQLIQNQIAYVAQGHVLFHVPAYPLYGALSGRHIDEQMAGSRIDVASFKKDSSDFVLWKPSTADQPGWESPWGFGRPGWHIECSAMAERYLGLPFDIHGGGMDLKFPHHENEIAQSCAAHSHQSPAQFAKYWVHNGFVTVDGEKMSKSVGNVQLVQALIKKHPGEVLRLALLSAHYSSPLNWTDALIHQSKKTLDRYYRALKSLETVSSGELIIPDEIVSALYDDLNISVVIAKLNQWVSKLTDATPSTQVQIKTALISTGQILGILQESPDQWLGYQSSETIDSVKIDALIQARTEARKARDFAKADQIRAELKELNIEVEDSPEGPIWRRVCSEN